MTQKQLAERARLSESGVKRIEQGRKNGPRLDTLEDLCEALDITLAELLGGAERRARWAADRTGLNEGLKVMGPRGL